MISNPYGNREHRYRAGNTVYGSGRNSPHMGTKLDPSGYVERELKKRRVDKRSRLAQGALTRLAQNNQGVTAKTTSFTPATSTNNLEQPGFGQISGTTPQGATSGNVYNPPAAQDPTDPANPFTPPKATLNGKLVPMPWEMQQKWIKDATALAQQFAGWDSQLNTANIDLGNTLRQMAQQRLVDNRNLAGEHAMRGMSFSSDNSGDITDLANMYAQNQANAQNYVANLQGQYGVGGVQRGLAQSAFDQEQAMLQAQAARILAQRAGTLGLGNQPYQGPKGSTNAFIEGPKPNDPKYNHKQDRTKSTKYQKSDKPIRRHRKGK